MTENRGAFTLDETYRFVIEERTWIDGYETDLVPILWLGVSRDGTVAVWPERQLHYRPSV